MFRDTIKAVAVSAVVSLAVSFGMLHTAPATQAAQAGSSEVQVSAARADRMDADFGSSAIVEVYSDGGYTYWQERLGWQG